MTIVITLRLHMGCIGVFFTTGIFGNFTLSGRGNFGLSERWTWSKILGDFQSLGKFSPENVPE